MTLALGVQLTELCAPGCAVCGPRERPRSLSPDTFERVLLEARALGIERLVLSGGEPLLHESLGDLVDQVLEIGVDVEIVATGHRLEQRQPSLVRLGPRLVRVWAEFLGGTARTHERATGRQGSFQEARAVLEVAKELGVARAARLLPLPDALREVEAWRSAVGRFEPELVVDRSTSHLPRDAHPVASLAERCADRESDVMAVVAASGRVFPCFAALGAAAIPEEAAPPLEERLRSILEDLAQRPAGERCGGCAPGFVRSLAALPPAAVPRS